MLPESDYERNPSYSDKIFKLSDKRCNLLHRQKQYMMDYTEVLSKRIALPEDE